MLSRYRDAGRVDLRKAGICKKCTLPVSTIGCCYVATLSHCRKIIDIDVTAGAKTYGITCITANLSCHHIPDCNALCFSINYNQIKHFGTWMNYYSPLPDLSGKGRISS